MAEFGVADRAGRTLVVHGVAAGRLVGGFDDHVAAEIRDFAAIGNISYMLEVRGLIERDLFAFDRLDEAFLGLAVALEARRRERLLPFVLARGGRKDDAIADAPAGDGLFEGDLGFAGFDRGAELEPCATHRRAMKLHAAAAADDRGARFLVEAADVGQADEGGALDRLVQCADQERLHAVP